MTQRVVVTAAAGGIGLGIAQVFLDAGAKVHICDVDADALDKALAAHPGLSGSLADVGSAKAVAALGQAVDEALGGVDVVINNAGVGGPRGPIDEVSDEDWDAVMRVNVTGMFYMVREFAPRLKAQGFGSIINISSTSVRTGLPNRTPYIVSKAAIEGLTKNLARELGPFNIRCNSISPGSIENDRGRALLRQKAEREGITYEEALSRRLAFISMRSRIDPREVGEAALFLASDKAGHITGQQMSVCGNVEWEG
jgi:NAD(P)-dependent dehydrogenase (short-subunit alcohol dehydrogenase family)